MENVGRQQKEENVLLSIEEKSCDWSGSWKDSEAPVGILTSNQGRLLGLQTARLERLALIPITL